MSALLRDEDTAVLNFSVKEPRHLPLGIRESLEEGMARALQLMEANGFSELSGSAENVARVVVSQVRPGSIMLED